MRDREISVLFAGAVVVMLAVILFTTSYVSSQRQADLLRVTCENAKGHRDLTLRMAESARIMNDVARELGLPIEPVVITSLEVPPECVV